MTASAPASLLRVIVAIGFGVACVDAAIAAPARNCSATNSFGTFALHCAVDGGRNMCTMQYNGDPAKGLRVVTRSILPGEPSTLEKWQTILLFASPQLALRQNQRPAVEIRPGRNSPVRATGVPTASQIVGVKSGLTDLTFWSVGEPATLVWKVKVDALPLVYSLPKSDFLGALNAMTDCQQAYARKGRR